MIWDVEERVEDAIAAYILSLAGGNLRVYSALSADQIEMPAVVVHCAESGPVSEMASIDGRRMCDVKVAVLTEAAPEIDAEGNTITSPRTRHANARSEVCNVLWVTDLVAQLNAVDVPAVLFSMAHPSTITRDVNTEGRRFESTITVEVIASPQEL